MGKPTAVAAGLGIGAALILWAEPASAPKPSHPAAVPKPATRTIIEHDTVTKVVQAAGHSGLNWPEAVVVIIVVVICIGALCAARYGHGEASE